MFKEGQTYKVKLELSPDSSGFGRATIISKDVRSLCITLKNSKGVNLKVKAGTKIWFVSGSSNNRFNGVWCSHVESSKLSGGIQTIICSIPKFEKQEQRRQISRMELNIPATLLGYEWQSLNARFQTSNISKQGIAFSADTDCSSVFKPGKELAWSINVDNSELTLRVKVVSSRFNWLLNRTELGAEFIHMNEESAEQLQHILGSIEAKQEIKKQLSESGSLARWVKAGKDNLGLVKAKQQDSELDDMDEDCSDEEDEHD